MSKSEIDYIIEISPRLYEINYDVDEEKPEEKIDNSPFDRSLNSYIFLGNKIDFEESLEESDSRYFIQKEQKNGENNTLTGNNISTKTDTQKTKKLKPSEKIFNINKINKKIGRLIKKYKRVLQGKHNKFSQDNIIQKIKVNFLEKIYRYINKEYEKYIDDKNNNVSKKVNKLIKKISPLELKKIKKENNLKWFSLKLKDVLSSNISDKYQNYDKNYNKKRIENLYEKNEAKNVINILEKSIREMYEIYSKDINIDGFDTLKNDLFNIKKKMENEGEEDIDDYLSKYEKTALNLEQIFLDKKSRNNKKEKN